MPTHCRTAKKEHRRLFARPFEWLMGWKKIESASRGAASGRARCLIVVSSVVVRGTVNAFAFSVLQTGCSDELHS